LHVRQRRLDLEEELASTYLKKKAWPLHVWRRRPDPCIAEVKAWSLHGRRRRPDLSMAEEGLAPAFLEKKAEPQLV
jgi:hypothetical protein